MAIKDARLAAARLLGLEEVPVVVAEDWTEEQKRAHALADNRLAELAGWDEDLLRLELGELRQNDFDLSLIGFGDDELNDLLGDDSEPTDGLTDEDEVPEPPAEPVTRRGDLWILGKHRLLCGDATSAYDVIRLMDGQRAQLFATDPPYLVDYDGTNHPGAKKKPSRHERSRNNGSPNGEAEPKHWDDSSQGQNSTRPSSRLPSTTRSPRTSPGIAGTPHAVRRCSTRCGTSSMSCITSRSSGRSPAPFSPAR